MFLRILSSYQVLNQLCVKEWISVHGSPKFVLSDGLLLTVQVSALAQNSVDYKFSGVFTWGKIISMLCDGGWCRTALPREFYSLEVPVSIYETSFENAFKALKMQALADGYVLTKTGAEKPYNVSVRPED